MIHQTKKPEKCPVSLAEVKAHLRLDHAHEDDYLEGLILAATTCVEDYTGRSFLQQTWRVIWRRDPAASGGFCSDGGHQVAHGGGGYRVIDLPCPPVSEVLSVTALFPGNKRKEIKDYQVMTNQQIPRVLLMDVYDAVEVEYLAGYGKNPVDVPPPLRQAILILVADWYENRGVVGLPIESSMGLLLRAYRVVGMV